MISTQAFKEEDAKRLNQEFKSQSPEKVLEWGISQLGGKIALACSFGAEDVVLVDMVSKIDPKARIFVLDTGRLHQETYDVMEKCRIRYGIRFEVLFPKADAVETLVREKGPNSFYLSIENRKECCFVRKVEPLERVLKTLQAWITGLRRDQAVTRTGTEKFEIDLAHAGMLKLNPLADWTVDQVWNYIKANEVPYNVLHDQGFPSIGCAPCTRAIKPGEDIRAGRWWWENPEFKECGLHAGKPKVSERKA